FDAGRAGRHASGGRAQGGDPPVRVSDSPLDANDGGRPLDTSIESGACVVPLSVLSERSPSTIVTRRMHRYGGHPDQHGELFLPDGPGKAGVAVVLHGGFWRDRYDRRLMDALCEDLASAGLPAWNVEYRRLPECGWPETFADVAAGIDALADLAVDSTHVVTIGHSAGGQL